MNWLDTLITVGTALLTTGGLWAIINAVFTKNGRATTAKVISEAQQVAQRTALESAEKSVTWLKAECERTNARLDEVLTAFDALLEAIGTIRDLLPPEDERTKAFELVLRSARKALY